MTKCALRVVDNRSGANARVQWTRTETLPGHTFLNSRLRFLKIRKTGPELNSTYMSEYSCRWYFYHKPKFEVSEAQIFIFFWSFDIYGIWLNHTTWHKYFQGSVVVKSLRLRFGLERISLYMLWFQSNNVFLNFNLILSWWKTAWHCSSWLQIGKAAHVKTYKYVYPHFDEDVST